MRGACCSRPSSICRSSSSRLAGGQAARCRMVIVSNRQLWAHGFAALDAVRRRADLHRWCSIEHGSARRLTRTGSCCASAERGPVRRDQQRALGMWIFLAFGHCFAALIAAYLVFRVRRVIWPPSDCRDCRSPCDGGSTPSCCCEPRNMRRTGRVTAPAARRDRGSCRDGRPAPSSSAVQAPSGRRVVCSRSRRACTARRSTR